MKKWFVVCIVLVLAIGLTGCTAGISISISPNPLNISSGDDQVNATVTVTTTGAGSLTISRIIAVLSEEGTDKVLYSYDTQTANNPDFPIQIPFVINGYSQSFELKNYIGEKTVNDLIAEHGSEIGVVSYDDLKGHIYKLKVDITTDANTTGEAIVNFN